MTNLPVLPRTEIVRRAHGEYNIDEYYLTSGENRFDTINQTISALESANPEYRFTQAPNENGGIKIAWARKPK